jgi:site-specific DNA-cytosine methylase
MLKLNNVLSCFDGASCAQMALKRAGIKYKNYYASEIEGAAIKVAQHNFPNTIHLGDIRNIKAKDLPKIDAIFAGSPCTDLSIAGEMNGMTTEDGTSLTTLKSYLICKKKGLKFVGQSYLFWEFVRLVKELKPKYFFLENTKMSKIWLYVITRELGVEPVLINSSVVSAQNRERYYWTNLPGFVPPVDKKITLNKLVTGAVSCGTRGRKLKGDDFYTQVFTKRKDGKANCVVTSPGSTNQYIKNGKINTYSIELAEKLQTWPVGYTNVKGISKTERYRMIGNGWTVDVISHFLKCANKSLKK